MRAQDAAPGARDSGTAAISTGNARTLSDRAREREIQRAYRAILRADSPEARRAAFELMRAHQGRRSAAQVAKMERSRMARVLRELQ